MNLSSFPQHKLASKIFSVNCQQLNFIFAFKINSIYFPLLCVVVSRPKRARAMLLCACSRAAVACWWLWKFLCRFSRSTANVEWKRNVEENATVGCVSKLFNIFSHRRCRRRLCDVVDFPMYTDMQRTPVSGPKKETLRGLFMCSRSLCIFILSRCEVWADERGFEGTEKRLFRYQLFYKT